ncbi:MAG: L-threonylcarbamoyladenylate synthase [Acidiferrobacterales bacterium]
MNSSRNTGGYSGSLGHAAQIIRRGGLVAYPTESCYGIGCDPRNARAVRRLLSLKQRPASKGLILIASNTRQLQVYVSVIDEKVLDTWPGPVTWLLQAKKNVPYWIRGKHQNVAVRISDHHIASKLCRATGFAIVSTSANLSGTVPMGTYRQVKTLFGSKLDYVLPGVIGKLKNPTPIINANTQEVIRP